MTAFDRLSRRFAERLGGVLGSDEDRVAVMAYGAYSLLYTAWSILLLIVFGILTGTLTGILAVSLAAALLRRTSGGAHASSPHRCAWIGVVVFGGLALAVKYAEGMGVPATGVYMAGTYGLGRYWVWRLAPVDSPAKPIRKPERRRRLWKRSLLSMDGIFGLLALSLLWPVPGRIPWRTLQLGVSTGLFWQAFTLTDLGDQLIVMFDKVLAAGRRE